MLPLKEFINPGNIDLNLSAESELETIDAMLKLVKRSGLASDMKSLANDWLSHEVYEPTFTDHCALIFHVLSKSVDKAGLFFGRFNKGISYYTKNGHPIDLIFLIISPQDQEFVLNSILSTLKEKLTDAIIRQQLREFKNEESAEKIILQWFENDE